MRGLVAAALAAGVLAAATGASATTDAAKDCKPRAATSRGSKLLGGLVGNVMGKAFGGTGIGDYVSVNTVSDMLTDAIACRLDPAEQEQAATATRQAVSRGVGASERWQSESRPGVSGTSTVTAQSRSADGTNCVTVSDVVIVDGEETTVPKRMCRAPGAAGYAVAA